MLTMLQQQVQLLKALNSLLNQEQQAIKSLDHTALKTIVDKKPPILKQIEYIEVQRLQLLKQAGFENNNVGIEAYLQQQSNTELSHLWHTLLEQLRICQKTNQVNARLLEMKKINAESALNILLGQKTTVKTYGANGAAQIRRSHAINTSA